MVELVLPLFGWRGLGVLQGWEEKSEMLAKGFRGLE